MRKQTDIHLLRLLEGVIEGIHAQNVFGGQAGVDEQGDLLVPQVLMRRAGTEQVRTLDKAPQDQFIDYTVNLISDDYDSLGDMEDRMIAILSSDINVDSRSGGFDTGQIDQRYHSRVFTVRMNVVHGDG